ncbi:hypothetical protein [Hymenobacter crusticola]|nr:hypothetical protein [Hymenobacter crusticola]
MTPISTQPPILLAISPALRRLPVLLALLGIAVAVLAGCLL